MPSPSWILCKEPCHTPQLRRVHFGSHPAPESRGWETNPLCTPPSPTTQSPVPHESAPHALTVPIAAGAGGLLPPQSQLNAILYLCVRACYCQGITEQRKTFLGQRFCLKHLLQGDAECTVSVSASFGLFPVFSFAGIL